MKREIEQRIILLLLSAIVGASFGIIGSAAVSRSLETYASALLSESSFVSFAPKKIPTLPGTYDEALERVRDEAAKSVATFMPVSEDTVSAPLLLSSSAKKGVGIVVSADGWVLTTEDVLSETVERGGYEVWVEKERYEVEKAVRDSSSPLVLVKLLDADGLSPIGFADTEDMAAADLLFALTSESGVLSLSLLDGDVEVVSGVFPAEDFGTSWVITEDISAGLPLLSSYGDLAGFSSASSAAYPLHHARTFIENTVRGREVALPGLGVYTLDLSRAYNLDPELRAGRYAGALVLAPSAQELAVLPDGPAENAGLMGGDIILDLDGEAITASNTLAELLTDYAPGEIANLRVQRDGVLKEIPVTLNDRADLLY